MDMLDVLRTKRDGGRLSDEQIRWFMEAFTSEAIYDEQAAAFAMAIYFQGMEPGEQRAKVRDDLAEQK